MKGEPAVLSDRAIRRQSHYFIYRPRTSVLGSFKEQFTFNCTATVLLSHNIILWDGLYGSHAVVFITQQTTLIQSNTGLF